MTIPLCIAGCGACARVTLNNLLPRPEGLELFFARRDEAKARRFNEEFEGAGYFGSYEGAVAAPEIDAVYFTTPHHVHRDNALLASRYSKHILLEKPIARTEDEAEEIIAAARDAAVKLMVAENWRFIPTVVRAKEMVARGNIRRDQAHPDLAGKPKLSDRVADQRRAQRGRQLDRHGRSLRRRHY